MEQIYHKMNLSLDLSILDIEMESGTYVSKKWENDEITFPWGACGLSGSSNERTAISCSLDTPAVIYLQYITANKNKKACL